MNKPFFYRLTASEFLAEVHQIPAGGHEEWLSTFALDLVRAKGSTEYTKALIDEAMTFKKRKAEAGKAGGLAKASNAKHCPDKT